MKSISGLVCGLLFGAGLALSGMTNTENVLGFLDLFGAWDITLVFVMGGGLLVTIPVYRFFKNKQRPIFDASFYLPETSFIDARLVVGAMIFGVGWGLYGYCPGQVISSLSYGYEQSYYFVVAMLIGMFAANLLLDARGQIEYGR